MIVIITDETLAQWTSSIKSTEFKGVGYEISSFLVSVIGNSYIDCVGVGVWIQNVTVG